MTTAHTIAGDFTLGDRQALQKLYDKAVSNGTNQFLWKGQPILTDFAKYLLEYLNTQPLQ